MPLAEENFFSEGACRDNPDFVDFPKLTETKAIDKSKKICRDCPVRRECWTYAYTNQISEGIWGGNLPSERTIMAAIIGIPAQSSSSVVLDILNQKL